ncbi:MAG: hypothetical protein N0E54_03190 [Candidatus Thiodiazotropha taylori]|nr:hypothetical protein [Candidatus Thiodiazotropha endolucinida]MCW4227732.1 hypothetical protein [Candidatus Thiodiazotropha taylori]
MAEFSEEEYLCYLEQQRHMFAWCLENIGKLSKYDAQVEATNFYKYRNSQDKYRSLVFHDDAWHWAMLKLKGEEYWKSHPELTEPTREYEAEWELYEQNHS